MYTKELFYFVIYVWFIYAFKCICLSEMYKKYLGKKSCEQKRFKKPWSRGQQGNGDSLVIEGGDWCSSSHSSLFCFAKPLSFSTQG